MSPDALTTSPERCISFERVANFRDLGGYRTGDGRRLRWRRLFRSGSLRSMTANDVERARQLGIMSVLDLRRPDEVRGGLGLFVVPPVHHHNLPLVPEHGSRQLDELYGRRISAERYIGYLSFGANPFVEAIELLAKPETYPAVVHCTAGKDRTGVLCAMVLDILGVDAKTIIRDYALSNLAIDAGETVRRWWFEEEKRLGRIPERARLARIPKVFLASPPKAIRGFLESVRDRYGSVRSYFEAHGVGHDTFEQLEDLLLDDS